ncbi:MAG: Stf0 family sulfotransferase, partial [Pseudomonadota bacterium]
AVRAVFDAARARGTGPNGIFALRLQRGSFTFFMEQAGLLFPGRDSDVARFEAAFGPTLFVHLSRRNKLAQAISLVRAQQTGLWHRHANGEELERTAPPEPPHYDRAAIAAQLEEFAAFDTAWADWFAREGVAPLRIDYDALIEAPRDVVASILEALSLDPSPADHVAVSTAKLADGVSAEWYAEFVRDARD